MPENKRPKVAGIAAGQHPDWDLEVERVGGELKVIYSGPPRLHAPILAAEGRYPTHDDTVEKLSQEVAELRGFVVQGKAKASDHGVARALILQLRSGRGSWTEDQIAAVLVAGLQAIRGRRRGPHSEAAATPTQAVTVGGRPQ